MDVFNILVLLHVVCAIIWVGGGFTLMVASELLRRRRGARDMLVVIDAVALLGPPFFVPLSFLTFLTGASAAALGYGFGELWVILGLLGFAATFVTGFFGLKPRAEKLSEMMQRDEGVTARITAAADDLVNIARFDYVMLGLVVAVMVLKPQADEVWTLAIMAALLALGGVLTLGRARRTAQIA